MHTVAHILRRLVASLIGFSILAGAALHPTTAAQFAPKPHRIGIHTIFGGATFYNTETGDEFVPRGTNYIDFHRDEAGGFEDRVLATDVYDSEHVRETFRRLRLQGYNTVRLFIDACMVGPVCITRLGEPGLNPAYMDNLADLMRIATESDTYLQLTSNDIPDGGGYGDLANSQASGQIAGYRNAHYLTQAGAEAFAMYWRDILTALNERDAPTDTVLGWQLVNEQWFFREQPPFSLTEGVVSTAAGDYDMGDPQQKRAMAVENVLHFVNTAAEVIRELDPGALVTIGFFAPQCPNATTIGGDWYVETAPLLARAEVDYFDFHAYPGPDISLAEIAENFGMLDYHEKPIVRGEYGAFRDAFPALDMAGYALVNWIAESCALGFDGWLYWEYYGQETPGDTMWGMVADGDFLLDLMSPATMPDPCVPPEVEFDNLAFQRPVTASAALPEEPAQNATDGSSAQWGSGADAPAWIEIDLEEPRRVESVHLTVAQWPAGETLHRVWAIRADERRLLLAEFAQATDEGDVLTVTLPALVPDVRTIRVETWTSPSWVSWREVEIYGDEPGADACVLIANGGANLRVEPTTSAARRLTLDAGRGAVADGQRPGDDGFVWYHLTAGAWVREDVVSTSGACVTLSDPP